MMKIHLSFVYYLTIVSSNMKKKEKQTVQPQDLFLPVNQTNLIIRIIVYRPFLSHSVYRSIEAHKFPTNYRNQRIRCNICSIVILIIISPVILFRQQSKEKEKSQSHSFFFLSFFSFSLLKIRYANRQGFFSSFPSLLFFLCSCSSRPITRMYARHRLETGIYTLVQTRVNRGQKGHRRPQKFNFLLLDKKVENKKSSLVID